jgi:hypothetical protein
MEVLCHPSVLMANDDQDDCLMATEAFAHSGADIPFSCVEDGKNLIERLWECTDQVEGYRTSFYWI